MSSIKLKNFLLSLAVFLMPFYFFRFSVLGIKTNVFEVFILILFIIFIVSYAFDYTIKKFNTGPVWVYLFLAAAVVSTFLALDKTHAAGILKGWFLFPVIFYLLIINNVKKDDVKYFSIPLYFSLIIVSGWAILQKLGIITTLFYQVGDQSFDQYLTQGRVFGPFESPNYLAMFLVPTFFLSLPVISLTKNKLFRGALAATFLLPFLALYFSTSRGGAVAFAASIVAILLFLYFRSKDFRKNVEKASSILIFCLILVAAIFLIIAARKISPNEGGDSIRLEIYRYTEDLIRNHPLDGVGLGMFQDNVRTLSKNDPNFQAYGLSYAIHPHNIFFALWLNLGIAGLITFLALVWVEIKNIFAKKKLPFLKACLFASLIAILVHGLVDTTYFKNDLSAIFWLIFALSVVIIKHETVYGAEKK